MITDKDITKLKTVFVTRLDVRKIVAEELDIALPKQTETITKILSKKIDKMYVKLDRFIGDIQTKRTEQKLHAGQHRKVNDRLQVIDTRLKITSTTD